jgi:hypothetical protein
MNREIHKVEVATGIVLLISSSLFIMSTIPWFDWDTSLLEFSIALYLLFEFVWKLHFKLFHTKLGNCSAN